MRVVFAGMTHLGLNSAAAAALRGHDVVGFDVDAELVSKLTAGDLPVSEPGLEDAVTKSANLKFSSSLDDIRAADVVYVAPDVPTDDHGTADVGPVRSLVETVYPNLGAKAVLVVLSQVQPGFSNSLGLSPDRLFYQVETLVFGQALDRALNPERFIVGCADPQKPLPQVFADVLSVYNCPILPMRYESAELAKIAINCCLVGSVTIANTLAELCESIGADWSEIVPALRLDKRIGQHSYIAAGLGIAGGNLERDLAAVIRMGAAEGTDTAVIQAAVNNSRYRKNWVLSELHESVLHAKKDPKVGVLGIAYKKDTGSLKNSASVGLMSALPGYSIEAYDPVAKLPEHLMSQVDLAVDPIGVFNGKDAVAIMTPWDAFADLDPADMADRMAGNLVFDPFGVLKRDEAEKAGLDYRTLGVGQ